MTELFEPWSHPILRHAFAEVAVIGLAAGPLGCWVLFFRLSYSAESLGHALFPGLVAASLLGAPLIAGGAVGIAAAGGGIAAARRLPVIGADAAIGIVVTTLFGLGALLALSADTPPHLQSLLFGDILGTTGGDIALGGALAAVVALALWVAGQRMTTVALDRAAAGALGVSAARVDALVLGLLAVTILVAVQALGNLLVLAVLIAPAAAAQLITRRMGPMMVAAGAIAVSGGIAGLYLSYYAETAAGASIAGILVCVYLLLRWAR